jgi:predicted transcriptional regulator
MAKELSAKGVNKTHIAKTLKVSRPTVIKWLNEV